MAMLTCVHYRVVLTPASGKYRLGNKIKSLGTIRQVDIYKQYFCKTKDLQDFLLNDFIYLNLWHFTWVICNTMMDLTFNYPLAFKFCDFVGLESSGKMCFTSLLK